DGAYTYRDLAAEPVPHIDPPQIEIMHRLERQGVRDLDEARGIPASPEEKASWEVTWPLVEELLAADTIVLGVPMYNFSVPSTFKAWFDRVLVPPLITDPATGRGPLSGKRVVVASARGGAYGPGTPRPDSAHQDPSLKAPLGMTGLPPAPTSLPPGTTKSAHAPRPAQFQNSAPEPVRRAL